MAESSILQFNPLRRHGPPVLQAETITARCGTYRTVGALRSRPVSRPLSGILRRQQLFPVELVKSRELLLTRASQGPTGDSSSSSRKSVLSIFLDILKFLVRIPAIFGLFKKEQKFIEDAGERVEDAAEFVEDIAGVVENVAEAVAKVAEEIAGDAKETRELMDKVEETTQAVRSDIGEAIDDLEDALKAGNPSPGTKDVKKATEAASRAADKAETVKGIAIQAADKAQKLKEATSELDKTSEVQGEAEESVQGMKDNSKGDAAAGGNEKERQQKNGQNKYQVASSSSNIVNKKWVMVALWLGVVGVAVPHVVSTASVVKYILQHSLLRSK